MRQNYNAKPEQSLLKAFQAASQWLTNSHTPEQLDNIERFVERRFKVMSFFKRALLRAISERRELVENFYRVTLSRRTSLTDDVQPGEADPNDLDMPEAPKGWRYV